MSIENITTSDETCKKIMEVIIYKVIFVHISTFDFEIIGKNIQDGFLAGLSEEKFEHETEMENK